MSMELKRENIDYDPQTGKLKTVIALHLIDGNGMMLKATAELYASIMDGIGTLVDAKVAEFVERYGEEVIKYAHNNTAGDLRDVEPSVKFVDSREIGKRLLNKAFEKENPNG